MVTRLSKLFGMDIYTASGDYKGRVFDLVINLERGKIETITTEPLKPRSKQEAKKILSEKSIPYRNVVAAKDIVVVGAKNMPVRDREREEEERSAAPLTRRYTAHHASHRR